MSTRVDTEEIESTRSEKLLALLMGVFLLVGAVWFYAQVPTWVDEVVPRNDTGQFERAMDVQVKAELAREATSQERDVKRGELDLAREEYKVALQEGRDAETAKQAYDDAQVAFDEAQSEARRAAVAADEADAALTNAHERSANEDRSGRQAWTVALIRLLFVAVWIVGAYQLIARFRRRESRYLALAFAGAAVGAIMALVFAVDYITDYIDPLDLGPFVLSALGVVATVVAFRVLQKHLAARVPGRRVRKGECPFCGFPVHDGGVGAGQHCAGCGRDVIGQCSTCGSSRRVGSPHCTSCGAA